MTPLKPTIILLQMTSHLTTNVQLSLKNSKNSGKSREACSSDRMEMILAILVLASSAAEERISVSSSLTAGMSGHL
jgi:hypothetical protein